MWEIVKPYWPMVVGMGLAGAGLPHIAGAIALYLVFRSLDGPAAIAPPIRVPEPQPPKGWPLMKFHNGVYYHLDRRHEGWRYYPASSFSQYRKAPV